MQSQNAASDVAVQEKLKEALEKCCARIEKLFEEKELSIVKLEEFEFPSELGLRTDVPIYISPDSRSKRPSLALSNLPNAGDEFNKFEQKILDSVAANTAVLFGVSGIGKTRRIYEMLCKQFGFLFISGELGYMYLYGNGGSSDFAICIKNGESPSSIARYVKLLIVSRIFVFCTARERWPDMTPKQWMLIQLYPREFLDMDIFRTTFTDLLYMNVCEDFLLEVAMDQLEEAVESSLGMLCFIDAAQKAHLKHKGSLGSCFGKTTNVPYGTDERDILSCISETLNQLIRPGVLRGTLISGTKMRTQTFAETSVGAADEEPPETNFTAMFPFNSGEVKRYIGIFMNVDKLDPVLLDHVGKWLVGRPIWTASFVQDWLVERKAVFLADPTALPKYERLQQRFVSKQIWNELVERDPESAWLYYNVDEYVKEFTAKINPDPYYGCGNVRNYCEVASTLIVKVLDDVGHGSEASEAFFGAVGEYALCGNPVAFGSESMYQGGDPSQKVSPMRFVELGLCCVAHSDSGSECLVQAQMCEPLIVEAAMQYMGVAELTKYRLRSNNLNKDQPSREVTYEHTCLSNLHACFNGTPIESNAQVLNNPEVPNDLNGSWRFACTSYGVLFNTVAPSVSTSMSTEVSAEVTEWVEGVRSMKFEGEKPPFSSVKGVGSDLMGYVVRATQSGLDWRFVYTANTFDGNSSQEESSACNDVDHIAKKTRRLGEANKLIRPSTDTGTILRSNSKAIFQVVYAPDEYNAEDGCDKSPISELDCLIVVREVKETQQSTDQDKQ